MTTKTNEQPLTYADHIFYNNLKTVMTDGVMSENARPHYSDGTQANSKYVTGVFNTYNLEQGEFPITTLRRIPIKNAIGELLWIYQDQSNDLALLRDKYNVKYWDAWDIGDGTIGQRYGYVVKKHKIIDKLLKQLSENPWNRRNVISLWDYESFEKSDGLLPCAYNIMFDVRKVDGRMYLDCTLTQRSNDVLVAHHINAMQYVALQLMIACHFGWEVGKFNYFINNFHIYDNQYEQASELMKRYKDRLMATSESDKYPRLVLNAPRGTNFYDINVDDFELLDYQPQTPQLTFDLAI